MKTPLYNPDGFLLNSIPKAYGVTRKERSIANNCRRLSRSKGNEGGLRRAALEARASEDEERQAEAMREFYITMAATPAITRAPKPAEALLAVPTTGVGVTSTCVAVGATGTLGATE